MGRFGRSWQIQCRMNDVQHTASDAHMVYFFVLGNYLVSSAHQICPIAPSKQTQPETNMVFGLCAQILVAMCVQKSRSAATHTSRTTHPHLHTTMVNQALAIV